MVATSFRHHAVVNRKLGMENIHQCIPDLVADDRKPFGFGFIQRPEGGVDHVPPEEKKLHTRCTKLVIVGM